MRALVKDSNRSYRKLAKELSMSSAAIIERIKRLEAKKIIIEYGVRFDYLNLGFEFMVVVEVSISGKDLLAVQKKIAEFPYVGAVWDTTGEYDAIVVLMCKNRSELSAIVKRINALSGVSKTNPQVVLNVIKRLTEFEEV